MDEQPESLRRPCLTSLRNDLRSQPKRHVQGMQKPKENHLISYSWGDFQEAVFCGFYGDWRFGSLVKKIGGEEHDGVSPFMETESEDFDFIFSGRLN